MEHIRTLIILLAAMGISHADSIFTGSSGGQSASVTFSLIGNNTLSVFLQNTNMTTMTSQPSEVLTAVLFDLAGNITLTPNQASAAKIVYNGDTVTPVGANWQYLNFGGSGGYANGAKQGISTTGLSMFGPTGNFSCGSACVAVDGMGYGIATSNYTAKGGNGGLGKKAMLVGSAQFTLFVPTDFTLSKISNVGFQYGTSITEPFLPGVPPAPAPPPDKVPEPAGWAMILGGGVAAFVLRRRIAVRG